MVKWGGLLILCCLPVYISASTLDSIRSDYVINLGKWIFTKGYLESTDSSAYQLCSISSKQTEFNQYLYQQLKNNELNQLTQLRVLNSNPAISQQLTHCSLVYIDKSNEKLMLEPTIRNVLQNKITVGETTQFLEYGGLFALIQNQDQVKLFISKNQFQSSGVKINARLLSIAKFYIR